MSPSTQLYQELVLYHPFDDAEAGDIKGFLKFIDTFQDHIYTRDNVIGHVCPTAFVVNKDRTKTLMAYHNQFQTFAWLGGHADGEINSLKVAEKEFVEESGLKNYRVLNNRKMFDFCTLYCANHIKRGIYVPAHLHYLPIYLFEADEKDVPFVRPEEHSAIRWFPFEEAFETVKKDIAYPVYQRIFEKIKTSGI